MSAPFVGSAAKALAAKLGFTVEVRTLTARRPKGWPTKSAKPVHLIRADGTHAASFKDGMDLVRHLTALRDAAK